jgi:hypothetical protein
VETLRRSRRCSAAAQPCAQQPRARARSSGCAPRAGTTEVGRLRRSSRVVRNASWRASVLDHRAAGARHEPARRRSGSSFVRVASRLDGGRAARALNFRLRSAPLPRRRSAAVRAAVQTTRAKQRCAPRAGSTEVGRLRRSSRVVRSASWRASVLDHRAAGARHEPARRRSGGWEARALQLRLRTASLWSAGLARSRGRASGLARRRSAAVCAAIQITRAKQRVRGVATWVEWWRRYVGHDAVARRHSRALNSPDDVRKAAGTRHEPARRRSGGSGARVA